MNHNNNPIFETKKSQIFQIRTSGDSRQGKLPVSPKTLRESPSGDLFGMVQNTGMGVPTADSNQKEVLILSTMGGLRNDSGEPMALGYHTGHFELDALIREAAQEFQQNGILPFAGYVSDPCDGRTQGTPGMMDSLAYRNDAAIVFRRLIRSLPNRMGVLGIATCDKGLPAMMMALASMSDLPCVLVPGGVTLPPKKAEDLGSIQSIGARFSQGEISLDYVQEQMCGSCASPGGGCHFLGTAATSQVVGEALGLCLTHSALAPSGEPIWLDNAERSAIALIHLANESIYMKNILNRESLHNAMVVYAAFGGSTNLLLHIPAIAHAAGLNRPAVDDWIKINKEVPRLVSVLPNGPINYPTSHVYLAGGVPEVMLHLRDKNVLHLNVLTVTGQSLGDNLEWWEQCERRQRLKAILKEQENINPDDVIFSPSQAHSRRITSTITFPTGNLAPDGCVIKSTAIDPSVLNEGVYHHIGPAKVFTKERSAIQAIKEGNIHPGDIMVLVCVGPMGSGMEETFQVTAALKYLSWGNKVSLLTDGRFSGVSTGACIGHIGPEALAGGPIGKVFDNDVIEIFIDTKQLTGRVNLIGDASSDPKNYSIEYGTKLINQRFPRSDLESRNDLPADTKLWAALQDKSGGTWGGCVYDVDELIEILNIK